MLSRAYVETKELIQTSQPSDEIDKRYGIWDRIFLDHVDIHYRGGAKKGPNQYGPVLFVLELDVLLNLPRKTDILVTKKNPIHWNDGDKDEDRFYPNVNELSQNLSFGNFDKMLMIRAQNGRLDFPNENVQIFLDNPRRTLTWGDDAYLHAVKRMKTAARKGGVSISIRPHECRDTCICVRKYAGYDGAFFDSKFA